MIVCFRVTWASHESEESFAIDANETTIANLIPFTTYMFSVLAVNGAGQSPTSTLNVTTAEAGNVFVGFHWV